MLSLCATLRQVALRLLRRQVAPLRVVPRPLQVLWRQVLLILPVVVRLLRLQAPPEINKYKYNYYLSTNCNISRGNTGICECLT